MADDYGPGEVSGHFEAEVRLIILMRTDASEAEWHEAMAELVSHTGRADGVAHIALVSIEGERKFVPDRR